MNLENRARTKRRLLRLSSAGSQPLSSQDEGPLSSKLVRYCAILNVWLL